MTDLASIRNVSLYAEYVGGPFQIEVAPDQLAEATLVQAETLGAARNKDETDSKEPFSLLFELQDDIDLPQQSYRITHEQIGEVSMFLVPVGQGRMESIFN